MVVSEREYVHDVKVRLENVRLLRTVITLILIISHQPTHHGLLPLNFKNVE